MEQAFQGLMVSVVAAGEAKKYKVSVPAAEVDKQVQALYTSLLGGKQNLAKFTALTGATADTLRAESLQQLQLQKVQEKIQKDNSTVSDADVLAYYNKNKKQYAQPEKRNLHVVLTKTEAEAKKARAELDGGAKFATVARKYSIDKVTREAGGKLENVTKGAQEPALDSAAFSTAATKLAGPVKTESGWYVVRVDKIIPAATTPYNTVKASLKQIVQQSKPSEALEKWQEGVVADYKKKTECREGFNKSPFCPNQPATTTAAPGGATSGQ
jgi:foldase protein PrsA